MFLWEYVVGRGRGGALYVSIFYVYVCAAIRNKPSVFWYTGERLTIFSPRLVQGVTMRSKPEVLRCVPRPVGRRKPTSAPGRAWERAASDRARGEVSGVEEHQTVR